MAQEPPVVVIEEDYLLRRIHPLEIYHPDEGPSRPFASAFRPEVRGEPLSVYVERLLEVNGLDESSLLVGHEAYFVVGFGIDLVRELRLDVWIEPDPDDAMDGRAAAHALVGGITKSATAKLAARCDCRIWP